jgi:hypothetical protein
MTDVDVHCHTFSADDLPVRGFIQRVELDGVPLGSVLAQLVDLLIQEAATDWSRDMTRVDALLTPEPGIDRPTSRRRIRSAHSSGSTIPRFTTAPGCADATSGSYPTAFRAGSSCLTVTRMSHLVHLDPSDCPDDTSLL